MISDGVFWLGYDLLPPVNAYPGQANYSELVLLYLNSFTFGVFEINKKALTNKTEKGVDFMRRPRAHTYSV